MQGRRLYDIPKPTEDNPHPLPIDYQPGDYWKSPVDNTWYFCCPKSDREGKHVGSLKLHTVTEHDDGTISVVQSILHKWVAEVEENKPSFVKQWHGYLEHGVWREA